MDKLQPLIRNHFWILAGLVVPMVLYGYYAANSSLVAATVSREKALDDVKQGVSTGIVPNEDYVKKLEHINTFLDSAVQDAIVDLWEKQKERMVWPQAVAARIPKEFMAEFDQQVPFIYKGLYPELIRKLQARVQPVEPLVTGVGGANPMLELGGRPMNTRTVPVNSANQKVMLMAMVPHAQFGQFGITSQEMWDAQIDIWLTEILLDAVVKMNEEKESISEAVIRRIDILELMGGTGERVTKDSAASGDMGGMAMDAGMPGMGMGRAAAAPTEISFSPAEEFGAAVEGGAGGDMSMSMEGPAGGGAPTPPKRYIAETEEAPFLERGFYMSVIMQQTKIADFIVTLANSDWPVQVRRFQVGTNPYRVETARRSELQFGGMGGMGMEGMGGMGMGGMSDSGMGMGRGMGMSGSSGRFGMPGQTTGTMLPNPYSQNLPEFAMGAMNHPDLVRVDLCGIITIYKQPKEALEAVAARKAAAAEAARAAGLAPANAVAPEVDGTSPAEEPMTDPAAAPEEGAESMPIDPNAAPAPAPGEAMTAPPAAEAPAAEPGENPAAEAAPAAAQ